MAEQSDTEPPLSQGVNDLIARLRDEGVKSGKQEAEEIVAKAKADANAILSTAKASAQDQLEQAKKQSEDYVSAGEDALKASIRDAVLEMKSGLMEHFSADVRRLISNEMKEPEFLKKLILTIAGRATNSSGIDENSEMEIAIPLTALGFEDLQNNAAELEDGELTKFTRGLAGQMMREGVVFKGSGDIDAGVKIEVKNDDVIIDVTDEAVANLLLQHLQPRFKAILEGVIQ